MAVQGKIGPEEAQQYYDAADRVRLTPGWIGRHEDRPAPSVPRRGRFAVKAARPTVGQPHTPHVPRVDYLGDPSTTVGP